MGLNVLSTTGMPGKHEVLERVGVEHVLTGDVARQVRGLLHTTVRIGRVNFACGLLCRPAPAGPVGRR